MSASSRLATGQGGAREYWRGISHRIFGGLLLDVRNHQDFWACASETVPERAPGILEFWRTTFLRPAKTWRKLNRLAAAAAQAASPIMADYFSLQHLAEVKPGVDCLNCVIRKDVPPEQDDDFFYRKVAKQLMTSGV